LDFKVLFFPFCFSNANGDLDSHTEAEATFGNLGQIGLRDLKNTKKKIGKNNSSKQYGALFHRPHAISDMWEN